APAINNELGAARMVGNLLGHFSISADIEPASHYRRSSAGSYAALFYLQISPTFRAPDGSLRPLTPPSALAQDVTRLRIPVCWLGGGLSALPTAAYGLRARDYEAHSPFKFVRYNGTPLTRGEAGLFRLEVTDPKRASVVATVVTNNVERSYAVRSDNFGYFGDSAVLGAEEGE